MYKVNSVFNVPAVILKSETKKVNGINTKTFTEIGNIFCSFKTYGGTEKIINDLITVEDTAIIETYYNNLITSDCKIKLLDDNSEWDIISPPEDIERKHLYLKFKVRRTKGNA